MSTTIPPQQYCRASAIRYIIYLIAGFLFPFLSYVLVKATNCAMDTCGAVSLVIGLYGRSVVYFIFALSFIGITIARVRDLQLPVWLAFIIPILLLGDSSSGIAAGATWSVGFVLGAVSSNLIPIITVWIIFLSFTTSDSLSKIRYKKISYLMLALLLIVAALGTVS